MINMKPIKLSTEATKTVLQVAEPFASFVGVANLPEPAQTWAAKTYGSNAAADAALANVSNFYVFAAWIVQVGATDVQAVVQSLAERGGLWLACLQNFVIQAVPAGAAALTPAREAGKLSGSVDLVKARQETQAAVAQAFLAAAAAMQAALGELRARRDAALATATPMFDAWRQGVAADYYAFMTYASATKLTTESPDFLRPLTAPGLIRDVPVPGAAPTGLPQRYARGFVTAKHPQPFQAVVRWTHGNSDGMGVGPWALKFLAKDGHDHPRLAVDKIKKWNETVGPAVQTAIDLEWLVSVVEARAGEIRGTGDVYSAGAAKDAARLPLFQTEAQQAAAAAANALLKAAPIEQLILGRAAQRVAAMESAMVKEAGSFEVQKFGTYAAALPVEIAAYQGAFARIGLTSENPTTQELIGNLVTAVGLASQAAAGAQAAGQKLVELAQAAAADVQAATVASGVIDELIDNTALGRALGAKAAGILQELQKRYNNGKSIENTGKILETDIKDPLPPPPPPPPPAGKGGVAPALGALALLYWLTR